MRNFFSAISIILLTISAVPAFAQSSVVLVSADRQSYVEGDSVVISGSVEPVLAGTPVLIQVLNPEDRKVQIAQILPAQDGSYIYTVRSASGILWNKEGEYTVRVSYGPSATAETTFLFSTQSAILETKKIFEVDAGSFGTFDVEYIIKGGTLKDMIIDVKGLALIVSIDAESDGSITLDISRELTDAKTSTGKDDLFIILIDGAEVPYQETKSSTSRTLTIQFLEDDSDIEIIGTYIIPEFGTITAMILAVAILSMIGLSVKTKLKILPKF